MMAEKCSKDFPYEVKVMDSQEKLETGAYLKDSVHLGSKKYLLPEVYLLEAANIYNFPLRSNDTFIVTFPKSGTTMTQELIWLLGNNLDYEKAASTNITKRFPYLEFLVITNELSLTQEQKNTLKENLMMLTINDIENMASPRFIKSHLPLSLLPPSLLDKTKVVYVIRDPRDVAVSFYHHIKLLRKVPADYEFKKFWECFISDMALYAPYFGHVLEAWEQRKHPNMMVLFYEDMTKVVQIYRCSKNVSKKRRQDMPSAIRSLATFFGKTLSDDQVTALAYHLDFNNFKKNKSVNYDHFKQCGAMNNDGAFIRKGKSGGWREYFDEEMTAQADEWIAKNLRDTDLRFRNC